MGTFKDNKGFTLIELLAVIVILAIVTVVATRSILPYMADAGKDTFVSEANMAIVGASDAISLIQLGKGGNNYYYKTESGRITEYCFTTANLNALGTWQKNDDSYGGRVVVTIPANSNAYTYAVNMHNASYYVNTTSGTIKTDNVYSYNSDSAPSDVVFDCTGYTQAS